MLLLLLFRSVQISSLSCDFLRNCLIIYSRAENHRVCSLSDKRSKGQFNLPLYLPTYDVFSSSNTYDLIEFANVFKIVSFDLLNFYFSFPFPLQRGASHEDWVDGSQNPGKQKIYLCNCHLYFAQTKETRLKRVAGPSIVTLGIMFTTL